MQTTHINIAGTKRPADLYKHPKVLIYKRTHKGDPDTKGIFGIEDCMGRIRNWKYDAVIGIGGRSPWKGQTGIKHKINWVGSGPKTHGQHKRGKMIVFEHFELYEEAGADICEKYPNLFDYMYGTKKRFVLSAALPQEVQQEIDEILASVKNSPPSQAYHDNPTISTDFNDLSACHNISVCKTACAPYKTKC